MTLTTYDDGYYLGEDPGLSRLFDNVQGTVPGVLLPAVKMAAWNSIEEFYWRSTWRREYLDWCMPPGITCIDFNPYDADWLVAWVLDIYGVSGFIIRPPSTVVDIQMPNTTNGTRQGRALVALKPVSLDAEFDPQLFNIWFETILDGTLYRLYLQPAKPYSSPQLASAHAKQYRVGCQRARAIAQKQYTNGPGRWSYPYFAGQTGAPLGGDILGSVGRNGSGGTSSSGGDNMPGPRGPQGPPGAPGPAWPGTTQIISASTVLSAGTSGLILVTNNTSAPLTVALPSMPVPPQAIVIKDGTGNASTFTITVSGGPYNIEGQPTLLIENDYGWVQVAFTGTQWVQI